jgi:DNA invertase Pin-like site-specific DNA recombinase
MANVGYVRVSTTDQHPEVQRKRLIEAGCEPDLIFTDHGVSGARESRPAWDECRAKLRKGDVLVVVKLDRIGRSIRNLIDISEELAAKGVDLRVLDQQIDTTTGSGKFMFHVLAAVAEFERDLIRERTKAGLAATKARGRQGGRKHRLDQHQVELAHKLRADGHSIRDIGVMLGNGKPVSRQTVYRALGMLDAPEREAARKRQAGRSAESPAQPAPVPSSRSEAASPAAVFLQPPAAQSASCASVLAR